MRPSSNRAMTGVVQHELPTHWVTLAHQVQLSKGNSCTQSSDSPKDHYWHDDGCNSWPECQQNGTPPATNEYLAFTAISSIATAHVWRQHDSPTHGSKVTRMILPAKILGRQNNRRRNRNASASQKCTFGSQDGQDPRHLKIKSITKISFILYT